MAHVQKRMKSDGSTVYVVKFRTPDGKQRSKGGFRTKKQAEAYATDAEFHGNRGTAYDPKSGNISFREVAEVWIASRHDLKPRTKQSYAYIINKGADLDTTFGGYPLNKITRADISAWVERRTREGKRPSTIKHAYLVLKMVLAQAVHDGRLPTNPSANVRLPSDRSSAVARRNSQAVSQASISNETGVVDPSQFLTAAQTSDLVEATPWPYNVLVHLAAWSGLRAAELAGLQVGDVQLPLALNPNAAPKPGTLRVERTALSMYGPISGGEGPYVTYDTPKTKGSRRRVPLPPLTVAVMREYLSRHPAGPDSPGHNPSAPLFPGVTKIVRKSTGKKAPVHESGLRAGQPMTATEQIATLSVDEAGARLALHWNQPLNHRMFYGAVYQPSVLRAIRLGADLLPNLRFHSLRHTYASLCVAAGISPLHLARFMGHSKVTTTLAIYTHLFEDDHSDAMAALDAMTVQLPSNVVRLRG
jgi:integrase